MTAGDFDELLVRLKRAEVQFVVIGGLAVGTWGVVRGTKDVDIVPASDRENLERLAAVAVDLGGHVQLGESLLGSGPSIAKVLAAGERVAIETDLGRLDVVQGLEGVPSYEALQKSAVETEVLGTRIAVCGLEDLRAMKRAAGRHRDLADLEDLEASEG